MELITNSSLGRKKNRDMPTDIGEKDEYSISGGREMIEGRRRSDFLNSVFFFQTEDNVRLFFRLDFSARC